MLPPAQLSCYNLSHSRSMSSDCPAGSTMGRLEGKVIVLTAAAQGIGRASAIVSSIPALVYFPSTEVCCLVPGFLVLLYCFLFLFPFSFLWLIITPLLPPSLRIFFMKLGIKPRISNMLSIHSCHLAVATALHLSLYLLYF